jgi:hypothetical protein
MRIFTIYSPADSDFYRLWERSWRMRGWKPAILTPKEIKRNKSARSAAKSRGPGSTLLCSPRTINFSYRKPRKTPVRIVFKRYRSPGWETADVVQFPVGASELDILNCGRAL